MTEGKFLNGPNEQELMHGHLTLGKKKNHNMMLMENKEQANEQWAFVKQQTG